MWTYQSDTAGVRVPELDLELASGTLGGVVTTVEGLITKICESECFFTFAFHFDSFFHMLNMKISFATLSNTLLFKAQGTL